MCLELPDMPSRRFANVQPHASSDAFRIHDARRGSRLEPLVNLLNGLRRKSDQQDLWPRVAEDVSRIVDGRSQNRGSSVVPRRRSSGRVLGNEELVRSENSPGRFLICNSRSTNLWQDRAGQT